MLNKTLTAAALAAVLATPAFAQSSQTDKPKTDTMQQHQSTMPKSGKSLTTGQSSTTDKAGTMEKNPGSTDMKTGGTDKSPGSMDKNADKSTNSMDKADKAAGSMDKSRDSMAKNTNAGTKQPGFVQKQDAGEWRASKLIGSSVYGPKDESIGDINELLIADDGSVEAVVVGVGGFLGIGEKDVAIPFDALNVQRKPNSDAIEKITVAYSKDELKNAPKFAYFDGGKAETTGASPNNRPGARLGTPMKNPPKQDQQNQQNQKK